MPIRVTCPSCGAGYNVGEQLQGKKIRCRQCAEIIPVTVEAPSTQRGIRAASPEPIRGTSRSFRKEDAEELGPRKKSRFEDDEEEPPRRRPRNEAENEEPRKKKKKRKKDTAGISPLLLYGGGTLVVCKIIGIILWLTLGNSPKSPPANANMNPKGKGDPVAFNQSMVH